MKKKIFIIIGVIILLAAFAANLQYVSTDYGIRDHVLEQDVLDQVNVADTLTIKLFK